MDEEKEHSSMRTRQLAELLEALGLFSDPDDDSEKNEGAMPMAGGKDDSIPGTPDEENAQGFSKGKMG